ncbi:hypothetical protein NIES3974_05170 [Calothrix sp. NIES-3974]|nr:hypothetical protein NIES3974_05170 [Calothrix sp. NIES-3974]
MYNIVYANACYISGAVTVDYSSVIYCKVQENQYNSFLQIQAFFSKTSALISHLAIQNPCKAILTAENAVIIDTSGCNILHL